MTIEDDFKAQTCQHLNEWCQISFTSRWICSRWNKRRAKKLEKQVRTWLGWHFTPRTSSVAVCVWSKRSAADLRRLPVSPWSPAGLPLTPAELQGEASDSTGCLAPVAWSSSAGWVAPARPSGRSWRDCSYQTPRTGCGDGHRWLGSGCVIRPDLSECE